MDNSELRPSSQYIFIADTVSEFVWLVWNIFLRVKRMLKHSKTFFLNEETELPNFVQSSNVDYVSG
jgi:hypothetical protein